MNNETLAQLDYIQTTLKLTNAALARRLGCSESAVERWRSGTRTPHVGAYVRALRRLERAARRVTQTENDKFPPDG